MEAEADWDNLRTPETYLGYGRGEHFASPDGAAFDERRAYELPERLRLNHWALAGEWTIGREKVVLDQAGGSIAYRFHARDAHLVLSPGARRADPFRVLLDGEAPGPSHGVDVDEDGNGVLRDGRLYQLVRQHDAVRERTLEITFLEPGAEAYCSRSGSRDGRLCRSYPNGPDRDRTCDLGIKSPLLYQLSYRPGKRGFAGQTCESFGATLYQLRSAPLFPVSEAPSRTPPAPLRLDRRLPAGKTEQRRHLREQAPRLVALTREPSA